MSQARAMKSQTINSLNYLSKVCNHSRSDSLSKALSFVRSYSSLSSAVSNESYDFPNPNEFSTANRKSSSEFGNNYFDRNPNELYRQNSTGVGGNYTRVYDQSYNSGGLSSGFQSNSDGNNGNYHRNQHSSNRLYEEGRNVQNSYRKDNGINYQISNGTYNGPVNSQVPNYSQPGDKLDGSCEEGQLHGTIEELDAFCKERKLKEAVEVLGLLEEHKISVDIPRYLFLMNECGETQSLEEAKLVHEHLTRSVSHLDVRICNKVLEMYSKCGSMEDAHKVFDKMPQRNLTSWDTMITGFAKNNHGEDAIDMFTEFKRIGLKPDSQMFFGVFHACSVLGDMKEGLLHFESMSKNYNIIPTIDHYKSVIDMLGSAGYLTDALQFIEKMPIEPSIEIWEILMNQCRIHGDIELGDHCSEIVQLLDPNRLDEHSKAGFVLIKPSHIAKEKEKKKLNGLNPLDIKTKVYEYRAGDTSHPDHEKLYSQLRCLKQSMKEVGYVPETKFALHDVDQESKEEALLSHSERLALSQALLTSPARSPIRIIKNLRVCGDCHNALKIISRLVGRQIVARDAKRFHHFENGVCSCNDYW